MAKSSNKSKEVTAQEGNPSASGMESRNGSGAAEPAKPAVAKKGAAKSAGRAKASAKSRNVTSRKGAAGRKPRAKTVPASPAAADAGVTDEGIRMRAYFIAEWRMQNGIAGDSANDWLEARRQLREEATPA